MRLIRSLARPFQIGDALGIIPLATGAFIANSKGCAKPTENPTCH